MTDWARCPVSRAALSILKNRDGCPFPGDCQFWDREVDGCGVRFVSEAMAGELLLRELNRLGKTDAHVAWELGVAKPTVSKWRHGRVRVPERRVCQLEAMLAGIKRKGEMDRDIVENRAYYKEGMTAEVRRMLRFLKAHGWDHSRVAGFCEVSRSAVSQWDSGLKLPAERNFEALVEKYGEVYAKYEKGSEVNNRTYRE